MKNGFRIEHTEPKNGIVEFTYVGFTGKGDAVNVGPTAIRDPKVKNAAKVKDKQLFLDLVVWKKVGDAGVKGAGTAMFNLAVEIFKNDFTESGHNGFLMMVFIRINLAGQTT
ncbi:hypothetical protein [Chitinophaga pinensis]|uniref:Uncharacterized protein n=1 Tax=Chitinophaga pinensis TaxID=79329 RepID=A0A5C6LMW9_9BACT|nr:hypothetical protein [Chitinophaga pinensis]TWV98660.1 hypothetical protein FEF09_20475 [Chitinophaga pinensis]